MPWGNGSDTKNAMDYNLAKLIEVCFRRSLDFSESLQEAALMALLGLATYCHEGRILKSIINLYATKKDFRTLVNLGLTLERCAPRLARNNQLYVEYRFE